MLGTILIFLNPFISHFIPTISLAHQLVEKNWRIVYVGFENLEKYVMAEGFEYKPIMTCTYEDFVNQKNKNNYKQLDKLYRILHREFKKIIEETDPKYILLGISRFSLFYLPAINSGAKVYLYSLYSKGSGTYFNLPPNTSNIIPSYKCKFNIFILIHWLRRFIRIEFRISSIRTKMYYPWNQMLKLKTGQREKWKFGLDGFYINNQQIVFGPSKFEFYDKKEKNIFFVGLGVYENRRYLNDKTIDLSFIDRRPLIYCNFGTLSYRYKGLDSFYLALLEIFQRRKDWQLLISMNCDDEEILKNNGYDNVKIMSSVPQLQVLPKTNLMITHGGFSTIKECIYFEVPMLVVPISYDQHGNAARVEYHRIGKRCEILKKGICGRVFHKRKKINTQRMEMLISSIIDNKTFNYNIKKLKVNIFEEQEQKNISILFNEDKEI